MYHHLSIGHFAASSPGPMQQCAVLDRTLSLRAACTMLEQQCCKQLGPGRGHRLLERSELVWLKLAFDKAIVEMLESIRIPPCLTKS